MGRNNRLRRSLVYVNEHTNIITINIIVNNVDNDKQTKHLAISETGRCRAMQLSEVIKTFDGTCKQFLNISELHGHLCLYRNVWPEVVLF